MWQKYIIHNIKHTLQAVLNRWVLIEHGQIGAVMDVFGERESSVAPCPVLGPEWWRQEGREGAWWWSRLVRGGGCWWLGGALFLGFFGCFLFGRMKELHLLNVNDLEVWSLSLRKLVYHRKESQRVWGARRRRTRRWWGRLIWCVKAETNFPHSIF